MSEHGKDIKASVVDGSTTELPERIVGLGEQHPDASPLLDRLRAKRTLPPADERRRIREAAGASLRDVARELGTSATSVIRWERGGSPRGRTAAYTRLLADLAAVAALPPKMRESGLDRTQDSRDNDDNDESSLAV